MPLANYFQNMVVILMYTSRYRTRKEGDPVTYDGTDFLQLDECNWLIKQVDMAQDYITLYHNLGDHEIKI
jgi:hypothetical protein